MYKANAPGGQPGGAGPTDGGAQPGQKQQDDVIDAEYVDADEKKRE